MRLTTNIGEIPAKYLSHCSPMAQSSSSTWYLCNGSGILCFHGIRSSSSSYCTH